MSTDRFPCEKLELSVFDSPECFVSEVTLNCTPGALFACFEDAEAWTEWVPAIQNVKWTSPQPFRVGTTRDVTLSGDIIGYEEFIAWEPGKRMAFRFNEISKDRLLAFGEDYQVTDLGDGRCHLAWRVVIRQKGFMKLMAPLLRPVMRRFLQKTLNGLAPYMDKEGKRFAVASAG